MRLLIGMLVCLGVGCAAAPTKPVQVEATQAEATATVADDTTETSTDQGAGEVDLESVKEEEIDLGLEGGTSSGPISVETIGSEGEEDDDEEDDDEEDDQKGEVPEGDKRQLFESVPIP